MKNAFNFILKALSAFKILKCLSQLFTHVEKELDKKDKVNLKIYDVTAWLTKNYDKYIVQYLTN